MTEFKNGQDVLVSDDNVNFFITRFIAIDGDKFVCCRNLNSIYVSWKYCKPIPTKKTIPLTKEEIVELALNGAWFKERNGVVVSIFEFDESDNEKFYYIYSVWFSYEKFLKNYTHYRLPNGEWLPFTKEIEE